MAVDGRRADAHARHGEARKLVPEIFNRARTSHVGAVTRSDACWDTVFADRKEDRQRRSWFTVVHESDAGEADGFVFYKVEQREPTAKVRGTRSR